MKLRELVPSGQIRALVPGVRVFAAPESGCRVLLSRDGPDQRWHLSISHAERYPTWDEIRDARYELVPNAVTMVMILPPREQYVNVQENTFHLHEIPEAAEVSA